MNAQVVLLWLVSALVVNGLTHGFTGSDLISTEDLKCLLDTGIDHFHQWAYYNQAIVDNAKANLMNFASALKYVSVLIYPHVNVPHASIAQKVCDEVITGTGYAFPVFIFVTKYSPNWHKNPILNRRYLEGLVDDLKSLPNCFNYVHIYTQKASWEEVLGENYTKFHNSLLLWSNTASQRCEHTGWVNFGGWTKPDGLAYEMSNVCHHSLRRSCYFSRMLEAELLHNTTSLSHI